jgi:hypothetical protein
MSGKRRSERTNKALIEPVPLGSTHRLDALGQLTLWPALGNADGQGSRNPPGYDREMDLWQALD